MKSHKRAVLFANGDFPEHFSLSLQEDDFLIAVDGGLRHLLYLGLTPQLLIGDLDSVSREDLALCIQNGVEIQRFPAEKDETDLELAVLDALQRGFTDIVITAAVGDRLDHTLGNLALLALPELQGLHALISNGSTTIYLINHKIELETNPGELVSLLPWGETTHGVTTSGLQYPLKDATLHPWKSRGLSNVATSNHVTVSVKSGQLFIFHIKKHLEIDGKEENA